MAGILCSIRSKSIPLSLVPPHVFLLGQSCNPRFLPKLLFGFNNNGCFASSQANKFPQFPPLFFQGKTGPPTHRLRIGECPLGWCALMVEVCQIVKFLFHKEPVMQQRFWECCMNISGCQLNERSQRQSHLCYLCL